MNRHHQSVQPVISKRMQCLRGVLSTLKMTDGALCDLCSKTNCTLALPGLGEPDTTNQCNPSSANGCNVCEACCDVKMTDGALCDLCSQTNCTAPATLYQCPPGTPYTNHTCCTPIVDPTTQKKTKTCSSCQRLTTLGVDASTQVGVCPCSDILQSQRW